MDNDKDWALRQISNLGYRDLDQVPVGRGNDYLSTLVEMAKGRSFGDVEFDQAIKIMRRENNTKIGLHPDETKQPNV